ncbi:MAG TPA: hypothetical protein VMS18_00205 [Candidatus Binatia bacterium]|nr:hypothetical protein [Candidatus Binatia bacterium]
MDDTTTEALEIQTRIQRSMSGEEKILLALDMSLFARELAKQRIRDDHPEWNEVQVARELLRIAFLPDPLPAGYR